MTGYVLGFLMLERSDDTFFLMIEKNRPAWQKGLINGIGGHVEALETPHEAMVREFQEETGIHIRKWNQFATMTDNKDFLVDCFVANAEAGMFFRYNQTTDEKVVVVSRTEILKYPTRFIENIPWLISMIFSQRVDKVEKYVIKYVR